MSKLSGFLITQCSPRSNSKWSVQIKPILSTLSTSWWALRLRFEEALYNWPKKWHFILVSYIATNYHECRACYQVSSIKSKNVPNSNQVVWVKLPWAKYMISLVVASFQPHKNLKCQFYFKNVGFTSSQNHRFLLLRIDQT